VVWAEAPDEDSVDEGAETEAHGDVDESFAARRLQRWIKGMFGGPQKAEPGGEAARPQSGPREGAPGEPGGSPGENH
jgi:hypothetical protein